MYIGIFGGNTRPISPNKVRPCSIGSQSVEYERNLAKNFNIEILSLLFSNIFILLNRYIESRRIVFKSS